MKKILLITLSVACLVVVAAAQAPTVKVQDYYLHGDTDVAIVSLPVPQYPVEVLGKEFNGVVSVAIVVDINGSVIGAKATRGPASICEGVTDPAVTALRQVAVEAALRAKFQPPVLNGQPAALNGWIHYDFQGNRKESRKMAGLGGAEANEDTSSGSEKDKASPKPKAVSGDQGKSIRFDDDVVNGRAMSLPKPPYPPAARAIRASGAVSVQVLIDEQGDVFTATSVSGHPLLRSASEIAACRAKFSPTLLSGKPVKVSGIITYNFVP